MNKDIELFFQYFNTAEIVYKDNVCMTNLNNRTHKYDVIPDEVEDAVANPNHTFTVLFKNGEKNVFELYTMKGHFHSTDKVNIRI